MSDHTIPEDLARALEEFGPMEKDFLTLWERILRAHNGTLYPLDFYIQGAVNRTVSQTRAIRQLLEAGNLLTARAVLRLQLDTAMRLHAAWLVPDPHKFVRKLINGKRVNQLKDSTGNLLKDAFLAKDLEKRYDWFFRVYSHTSGYVHLSLSQSYMSFTGAEHEGPLELNIAPDDWHMPVSSFVEVAECFKEASEIVFSYANGWLVTKSNPETVAELRKQLRDEAAP